MVVVVVVVVDDDDDDVEISVSKMLAVKVRMAEWESQHPWKQWAEEFTALSCRHQ